MTTLRFALLSALLGPLALSPSSARAQDSVARADALFAQGKERMADNDYERGCPLLAASFQADPATGTLLALAVCYERANKLASAHRTYGEVVVRSKREGRADREQAAQERVTALAPRLSKLIVRAQRDFADLELRLDGVTLDKALFGVPIAVDGGVHRVEAWSAGERRWSGQAMIANDIERKELVVPALQPPVTKRSVEPAPRALARRPAGESTGGLSGGQIAGVATMGAGALGFAIAGGLAIAASNKNQASKAHCDGDLCTAHGQALRRSAWNAGNGASLAVICGAALAVVGVSIFFASDAPERPAQYAVAPWVAHDGGGAALQAAF